MTGTGGEGGPRGACTGNEPDPRSVWESQFYLLVLELRWLERIDGHLVHLDDSFSRSAVVG
eukprot:759632-Hanusia_phi.AAC.3